MEELKLMSMEFHDIYNLIDVARRLLRYHSYKIPNATRKSIKLLNLHYNMKAAYERKEAAVSHIMNKFSANVKKTDFSIKLTKYEWEVLLDLMKDSKVLSDAIIENLNVTNNKLLKYLEKLRKINDLMTFDIDMKFDERELYVSRGTKNYWKDVYDRAVKYNGLYDKVIPIVSRLQCIQGKLPEITN